MSAQRLANHANQRYGQGKLTRGRGERTATAPETLHSFSILHTGRGVRAGTTYIWARISHVVEGDSLYSVPRSVLRITTYQDRGQEHSRWGVSLAGISLNETAQSDEMASRQATPGGQGDRLTVDRGQGLSRSTSSQSPMKQFGGPHSISPLLVAGSMYVIQGRARCAALSSPNIGEISTDHTATGEETMKRSKVEPKSMLGQRKVNRKSGQYERRHFVWVLFVWGRGPSVVRPWSAETAASC